MQKILIKPAHKGLFVIKIIKNAIGHKTNVGFRRYRSKQRFTNSNNKPSKNIYKMKTRLLSLLLLVAAGCMTANAQTDVYEKYRDNKDVTVLGISKFMLRLLPSGNVNGIDLDMLKEKMDAVKVITANKKKVGKALTADVKEALAKGGYQELATIAEGNKTATVNALVTDDIIKEFSLLIKPKDGDDATLVIIQGQFTMDDVEKLARIKK